MSSRPSPRRKRAVTYALPHPDDRDDADDDESDACDYDRLVVSVGCSRCRGALFVRMG